MISTIYTNFYDKYFVINLFKFQLTTSLTWYKELIKIYYVETLLTLPSETKKQQSVSGLTFL
jgi:hypothetical protein